MFIRPKDVVIQLLIAGALMGAVLFAGKRRLWISTSPLSIPLVGLILFGGLSAWRSLDPLWSLLEVANLALLVALFHLLLGRAEVGRRTALIFRTMAIVGGAAAFYGLLQLVGIQIVQTDRLFIPFSFFGNRNYAAEYILLVLPPALALTLIAPSRRALVLWSVVSALLVLHLAATQTRAALGGLTLGLLGAAAFWRYSSTVPEEPSPSARRWLLVGSILAIGYLLFFFPRPFNMAQPIAARALHSEGWDAERVAELANLVEPGSKGLVRPNSSDYRLSLWRAGLPLIRDHPWTGVGLTNLVLVFPPRYQPLEHWLWPPQGRGDRFLHNELLQVTAELGLPAVALIFWILGLSAVILRRSLRASLPGRDRLWIAASLCALIALGVDSLVGFPWHLPVQRLYAVIHGASLVALASHGPAGRIQIARWSGLVAAGAFLAIVALAPVRLEIAETYAVAGWRALSRGAYAEAAANHDRAATWFPPMFPREQRIMQAVDPRPHYEKAIQQLRETLRRNPQDQAALTNLGRALQGAGRLEEAVELFHRLLEKKPGEIEILRRLSDLALLRGRPDEAYRHYKALAARAGCNGPLLFWIGVGYHRSGKPETARTVWEQAVACDPRLAKVRDEWLKR